MFPFCLVNWSHLFLGTLPTPYWTVMALTMPSSSSTQAHTCGYSAVLLSHSVVTVKDRLNKAVLELYASHSTQEKEVRFQQWISPERCHHLIIGKILMIVVVDGMTTRLCIGPSCVLVSIESQLKVFCKRHRPRIVGQGNNWCHLKKMKAKCLDFTFLPRLRAG